MARAGAPINTLFGLERLVFRYERSGTDQTVFRYDRTVHDRCTMPIIGTVHDGTAMQHGQVSDGNVFSQCERSARVCMQDSTILNVGVFTDDNPVVVAPDSHVIPDGGMSFNDDVADNGGVFCNESSRMNLRRMLAQSINGHRKVYSES